MGNSFDVQPPVIALPRTGEPTIATDRRSAAIQEFERRSQSGELSPQQGLAWEELKKRLQVSPESLHPTTPEAVQQHEGFSRPVGVAATGFNKGLALWVDLMNDGLQAVGIPTSDMPFMGSAFVDKYLAGAQFEPQNLFESVVQRAGLEVGANVPLLGASGIAQARGAAKVAAGAVPLRTGTTKVEVIKNLPKIFVEELVKISPAKLAAVESALAAGAGTGAEIVAQVFPEGGPTSEFVGELLGAFAPSVVLGMVRRAREGVRDLGRVAIGYETKEQTAQRLGKTLQESATPDQLRAGVERAQTLRQELSPGAEKGEGLELPTAAAVTEGSVPATSKAVAAGSPQLAARLNDQRRRNIQEVMTYLNETAPEGNMLRTVERLEAERGRREGLLKLGVERTQAKVDAMRGQIDKRTAVFLDDLEHRLWRAEQDVDQRLTSLKGQLSPKQRGELIRQVYHDEVGKWREQSRADYHELDMLGHAELPVHSAIGKLADLRGEFPAQIQAITKINPRVARVLDDLGHDYELIQRAEKAQADLDAVGGKSRDQRGGVRIFDEQQGAGSTPRITGIPSNYPDWYRSLASGKNALTRDIIEKALDTIKTGQRHGLQEETIEHVQNAILSDREFRQTSFFEPVMDELNHAPSASIRDLRQVRSDLLALARQARASDNRVQGYVLNELIGALDRDIDQVLPGQSPYAELYPRHGDTYRQVSADYRAGVDRLMKGTANKVRRVRVDGSYVYDDESVADLFWRNQTSLREFEKAFPNKGMAQLALRDHALADFYGSVVKVVDGKHVVDTAAHRKWMEGHQEHLAAFPDLQPTFMSAAKLQARVDVLQEQANAYRGGRAAEERVRKRLDIERRPGEFSSAELESADRQMNRVLEVAERSRLDWEKSKAGLYLRESPEVAAGRIVLDRNPVAAYHAVLAKLGGDPEAVAGLKKAIWQNITDTVQPRLIGVTGDVNLGVIHKALEQMMTGYGGLMKEVLGPAGFKRVQTGAEVIERIATGAKAGSDTAINLTVHAALASSWLSRAWATLSGRVPAGFGAAERGLQMLIKTLEKHTAKQQEEILLEAFTDPKVFQTLVNAAQYGPDNRLVQHQMKVHLYQLNLSEQRD